MLVILKFYYQKKYSSENYELIKKETNNLRKTSYIECLVSNEHSNKEIKLNLLLSLFLDRYEVYRMGYANKSLKLQRKFLQKNFFVDILKFLNIGIVLFVLVRNVYMGNLLIGTSMTCFNGIQSIDTQLEAILQNLSFMTKDSFFLKQLVSFLEKKI